MKSEAEKTLPTGTPAPCGFAAHAAAGRWLPALLLLLVLALPAAGAERTYRLDADASDVRIFLDKRGALAFLAHRHVIVARGISGRITADPEAPRGAAGEVRLPVRRFEIDAAEAREAAGMDKAISDDARADVRETMLSAKQLDARNHPHVLVTLAGVEGTPPDAQVSVRVRLLGAERTLTVPAEVSLNADSLRARGEFTLSQRAFGLEPYANLLGSIAVADEVRVRFDLQGRAEAP